MADKKISQLTAITGTVLDDADLIPVVDSSASETKKITFGEFKTALDQATGFVRVTGDTMTGGLTVPTADINGGTIDGTTIGSASPAAITGTALTATTSATLQHSASTKLATAATGIDVTGTVTADGLTVDGVGTITNTSAGVATALSLKNNTVGANNRAALDFFSANTKYVTLEGGYGAFSPEFNLKVGSPPALVMSATSGGNISFYEDLGVTPKFYWDASAESLGIGTSSLDATLTVEAPQGLISVKSTTGSKRVALGSDAFTDAFVGTTTAHNLSVITGGSIRAVFDTAGNVGIGTNLPSALLDVVSTSNPSMKVRSSGGTIGNYADITLQTFNTFSGSGQAFVRGVSSASGNSNTDLLFGTNDSGFGAPVERLRITSTGSVGIGTSSPAYRLDVAADNQRARLLGVTGYTLLDVQNFGGSFTFGKEGASGGQLITGSAPYDSVIASQGSEPIHLATNSAIRMTVAAGGSVGIGTSSPAAPLHVQALGKGIQLNDGSNESGSYIQLAGSASYKNWAISNNFFSGGALQFSQSAAAGGVTPSQVAMTITSTGSVGIGTSSPASTSGACVDATGPMLARGYLNAHQTSAGVLEHIGDITKIRSYGATAGSGAIAFNTGGGGGSIDTERMRIDASGNVGIGTSTMPAGRRLVVSGGNIRLDTDYQLEWGGSTVGLYGHGANNTLHFFTNTAERMRITSTGSVGIGTSSPDAPLTIKNPGASGDQNILTVQQNGVGTGALAKVVYNQSDDSLKIINTSTYGGSYLGLWTNNTERLRIDASGHAIIPAGVTLGTAAGVYSAANTLDDYEEGTFTPVLYGGSVDPSVTYTVQAGSYTKVGSTVTVLVDVRWSAQSGGSGVAIIGGLPFSSVPNYSYCAIGEKSASWNYSTYTQYTASIINNNQARVLVSANGLGSAEFPITSLGTGAGYIIFSLTYKTNA